MKIDSSNKNNAFGISTLAFVPILAWRYKLKIIKKNKTYFAI